MAISDWPNKERPREKLVSAGASVLSDAELLAIFFRTGIKGKSAIDLARDTLKQFGTLRELLQTPVDIFCQQQGLGLAKYVVLQAALEMGQRCLQETLERTDVLLNTHDTEKFLTAKLRALTYEVFAALFLDSKNQVICYEVLGQGTLDTTMVYPREVVKRALAHNAAAIIFAHNHPSGISEPSPADKQLTLVLKQALALVGVRVLDHMIIGEGRPVSFASRGLI